MNDYYLNSLLIALLFVMPFSAQAQFFQSTQQNVFIPLQNSQSSVGDYDRDGDMDIVVMGIDNSAGSQYRIILYNNDGQGIFQESEIIFTEQFTNGDIAFVNIDRDDDLDIFITGLSNNGEAKTLFFVNDGATFIQDDYLFNNTITNGQFAWGDLNNDKYADLLLFGEVDAVIEEAYLFKGSRDGTFESITHDFLPSFQGVTAFADFDRDGDLDVATSGASVDAANYPLYVYENLGDFNFQIAAQLEGFSNGSMKLRDINEDSFVDIIKTGSLNTNSESSSKVYLNNANFDFILAENINLTGVGDESNLLVADFTGNGSLDLLNIGRVPPFTQVLFYNELLENDGDFTFVENTNTGLPLTSYNDMEVADFDLDGDLDLFVVNSQESDIYFNTQATPNEMPSSQPVLESAVAGSTVLLSWEAGTDTKTAVDNLSYNLYIGTEPNTSNILSPNANIETGLRYTVELGNNQYNTNYNLVDFEIGTYYWAVQTIDNQYIGSPFSQEQSFEIKTLGLNDDTTSLVMVANDYGNSQWKVNASSHIDIISLYTLSGQSISQYRPNAIDFTIDYSELSSGIYILSLKTENGFQAFKVIKN
jgi:hypothetical protein